MASQLKQAIQSVINDKEIIRNAINTAAQGSVVIPADAKLSEFASYVNQIPQLLPEPPASDVNFFDYDGVIRYSYTATEFASLSALPALPKHEDLDSQEWNWTLADAKAEVATTGSLNIGLSCASKSGNTELYVKIPLSYVSSGTYYAHLNVCGTSTSARGYVCGFKYEDWKAGNRSQSYECFSRFNISGNTNTTFEIPFTQAGPYVLMVVITAGAIALGHTNQRGIFGEGLSNSNCNNADCSILHKIYLGTGNVAYTYHSFQRQMALKAIAMPKNPYTNIQYPFRYNDSLKFIVYPNSSRVSRIIYLNDCSALIGVSVSKYVTQLSDGCFSGCRSLKYFTPTSYMNTSSNNISFYYCSSLQEIKIPNGPSSPTAIAANAFSGAQCVKEIEIPGSVTSMGNNPFANCYSLEEIRMRPLQPPTITSTTLNNIPSTCKLSVAYPFISMYATATNWTTRYNHANYPSGQDPRNKNDMFFISNPNSHVDLSLNLFVTYVSSTQTATVDYVGTMVDEDLLGPDWSDLAYGSWAYNSDLDRYFFSGFSVFIWLNPEQDYELINYAPASESAVWKVGTIGGSGYTYQIAGLEDRSGESHLYIDIVFDSSLPWGLRVDRVSITNNQHA